MLSGTLFIVLSLANGHNMLHIDKEPQCSSYFDFQEKLLEKVMRTENTVEIIKGKVEGDLLKFGNQIKDIQSEFNDMINKMNKVITDVTTGYKVLEGKADVKLDEIKHSAGEQLAVVATYFDKAQETVTKSITNMTMNLKNLEAETEKALIEIKENADKELSEIRDLAVKKDVVFHVTEITVQPDVNSVIKFKNVMVNTDSVYNMKSGYFTAPKSGTYWFAAQICTPQGKQMSPSIHIKNALVNRIFTYDKSDKTCATLNAVAMLQTGDRATLRAGIYMSTDPVWINNNYNSNTFMGSLIN